MAHAGDRRYTANIVLDVTPGEDFDPYRDTKYQSETFADPEQARQWTRGKDYYGEPRVYVEAFAPFKDCGRLVPHWQEVETWVLDNDGNIVDVDR